VATDRGDGVACSRPALSALLVAAAAGTVHGLFSLYWAVGGGWLVSTLGRQLVDMFADKRWLLGPVAVVKIGFAVLPLLLARLAWPAWRPSRAVCWTGAAVLVCGAGRTHSPATLSWPASSTLGAVTTIMARSATPGCGIRRGGLRRDFGDGRGPGTGATVDHAQADLPVLRRSRDEGRPHHPGRCTDQRVTVGSPVLPPGGNGGVAADSLSRSGNRDRT
jgi:hypothetical protein